jgi:hypothetical protein
MEIRTIFILPREASARLHQPARLIHQAFNGEAVAVVLGRSFGNSSVEINGVDGIGVEKESIKSE